MAVDTKVLAFGIVVGATILGILYHLTIASSVLVLYPTRAIRIPPEISYASVVQSFKRSTRSQPSDKLGNDSDSDSILLAIRKERRKIISRARQLDMDLTSKFFQLYPAIFTCPYKEERIGDRYNTKYACGIRELYGVNKSISHEIPTATTPFLPNCVMYSFGVGPQVAVEEAILQMTNCKVFAYDHTVEGLPSKISESKDPHRMVYQPIGVEEYHKYNKTHLKTIKNLMDINDHDWIDILKIDAEGAEYGSLNMLMDDFEDEGILPFDQLLVEIHNNGFDLYSQILPWFNRLEYMGLRVTHKERNPLCNCFEYNFVNVRGKVFRNSTFDFSNIDVIFKRDEMGKGKVQFNLGWFNSTG